MTPGDIADASGSIWLYPVTPPLKIAKLKHGCIWLTPRQASTARRYGWQPAQETTGLVAVERGCRAAIFASLKAMFGGLQS